MKPHTPKDIPSSKLTANGVKEFTDTVGGICLQVDLILCEDNVDDEMANWEVENLKFSLKQPVMGISYLKYVVTVPLYMKIVCD